jgi:hypothetical protein
MARIETIEQLETLYGTPKPPSLRKVATHLTPAYRRLIEAAPFLALATVGPEGVDVSPRGDRAGELTRIVDERTLILPDRRGNDRIDSLRNVVRDPRVALMFLIPGYGSAIRVNGRSHIEVGAELLASFSVDGKAPRSVLVIGVEEVYFQCSRAMIRSGLWGATVAPSGLPMAGEILADMTAGEVGGAEYDRAWPERAAQTMW